MSAPEEHSEPQDWQTNDYVSFLGFAIAVISLGVAAYLFWTAALGGGRFLGEDAGPTMANAARDRMEMAVAVGVGGTVAAAALTRSKWAITVAVLVGALGAYIWLNYHP